MVEYLLDQGSTLWNKLERHFPNNHLRQEMLSDYRHILEAIATNDVVGARRTMRDHLKRLRYFLDIS